VNFNDSDPLENVAGRCANSPTGVLGRAGHSGPTPNPPRVTATSLRNLTIAEPDAISSGPDPARVAEWRSATRGAHVGFDLRRMHASGIGRYARSTFAALQREAPELHWTAVLQSESDVAWVHDVAPTAKTVVSPAPQYSPAEMLRLPAAVGSLDIWHSPHPFQLDAGRRASKLVLTLLDLIPVTHPATKYARRRRLAFREFVRLACRRAHAMVSISSFTRSVFQQRLGVDASRVTVTHLAADASRFAATPSPALVSRFRKTLGLPRHVVLYVGMVEPHKNVRVVVDALRLLRHRLDIGLAIVGSTSGSGAGRFAGVHHAALREYAEASSVGDRLHWLGGLSDEDLRLAYASASVVVQPSLVEGFGLTLLEGMASGVPVAASNIPVFREVAGDAVARFDPANPHSVAQTLERVLSDPEEASRLERAGRERAARFSWNATARWTLEAYARALTAR
jgi:glycosyltransferase involved in cell wall biosynthesis